MRAEGLRDFIPCFIPSTECGAGPIVGAPQIFAEWTNEWKEGGGAALDGCARGLGIPGDRPTEVGISLLKQMGQAEGGDGNTEGAKDNGLSVLTEQSLLTFDLSVPGGSPVTRRPAPLGG